MSTIESKYGSTDRMRTLAEKWLAEYFSDGIARRPGDLEDDLVGAVSIDLSPWRDSPFFPALTALVERGAIVHERDEEDIVWYALPGRLPSDYRTGQQDRLRKEIGEWEAARQKWQRLADGTEPRSDKKNICLTLLDYSLTRLERATALLVALSTGCPVEVDASPTDHLVVANKPAVDSEEDSMSSAWVGGQRGYTKEEAKDAVLAHIRALVDYWAAVGERSEKEKLSGLAFSILNIFDGTTMALPSMDIVLRPHPDDEEYNRSNGAKWWVDGMVVNDGCALHEEFYGPPTGATERRGEPALGEARKVPGKSALQGYRKQPKLEGKKPFS